MFTAVTGCWSHCGSRIISPSSSCSHPAWQSRQLKKISHARHVSSTCLPGFPEHPLGGQPHLFILRRPQLSTLFFSASSSVLPQPLSHSCLLVVVFSVFWTSTCLKNIVHNLFACFDRLAVTNSCFSLTLKCGLSAYVQYHCIHFLSSYIKPEARTVKENGTLLVSLT